LYIFKLSGCGEGGKGRGFQEKNNVILDPLKIHNGKEEKKKKTKRQKRRLLLKQKKKGEKKQDRTKGQKQKTKTKTKTKERKQKQKKTLTLVLVFRFWSRGFLGSRLWARLFFVFVFCFFGLELVDEI
jgi:hypothetical protein